MIGLGLNIANIKRGVSVLVNALSTLFDGVNERVDVPDDSSLSFERTDPFSISTWVQMTALGAGGTFLSKRLALIGYIVFVSNTNQLRFLLNGASSTFLQVRPTTLITDTNWHHYVFTYDGSSTPAGINVYIDGVADSIITIDDTPLSTTIVNAGDLKLGANGGNSIFLNGNEDEVSVWNKELTASEASEIYNSGVPKNLLSHSASADLVAWWRMGDGDTFPTILDNSTNTNNGTMVNMEAGDFVADTP